MTLITMAWLGLSFLLQAVNPPAVAVSCALVPPVPPVLVAPAVNGSDPAWIDCTCLVNCLVDDTWPQTLRVWATPLEAAAIATSQPTLPQVLGSAVRGGAIHTGDSGWLDGSRFTTPAAPSQIAEVVVFVGAIDVANQRAYQVGVYTDVNGEPGTLVAVTAPGTLVVSNTWNHLAVAPGAIRLNPSTPYWLIYNTNGTTATVNNLRYTFGPCCDRGVRSVRAVPYGTWPTVFRGAARTGQTFSIYATLVPQR